MTDLPHPVGRLLDAANRHDSDAFLACFTDGGVVDDWGRQFGGAAAIKSWSDREFIGVNVALDVRETDVGADGDVTIGADVGGDGFNGPSHFTFRLRDGLVSRMTIRQ
jgi:SnoaL-like protein